MPTILRSPVVPPNPNQHSNDLAVRSLSFRSLQPNSPEKCIKLWGWIGIIMLVLRMQHHIINETSWNQKAVSVKISPSLLLKRWHSQSFPPVPRIQRWAWGGRRESPKKWKCRSSAAVSWLQTGADRLLGKSPWAIQSWIRRARPSPRQQQAGLMPDPFVTIGLQNWGFKWGLWLHGILLP